MSVTTGYSSWTYLPLSDGGYTTVSCDDMDKAGKVNWRSVWESRKRRPGAKEFGRVYVKGWFGGKKIYLHRFIVGIDDPSVHVDHINGNALDNRRENLRLATQAENSRNRRPVAGSSSSFLGVTWHKNLGKWQASLKTENKSHYLGVFEDEEDAARAYDEAARKFFGDFAHLNFREEAA